MKQQKMLINIIIKLSFAMILISALLKNNAYAGLLSGIHPIIYDEDQRYEVNDSLVKDIQFLSKSVAAIIEKKHLRWDPTSDSYSPIKYRLFEKKINGIPLCPEVQFLDQLAVSYCTAFLIEKDIVVTAAHCFKHNECADQHFIFNYDKGVEEFSRQEVYSCKEVLKRKSSHVFSTQDYMVVRLNREVKGAAPLRYRKKGMISQGQEVFMIGHPRGLPTKIATGGHAYNEKRFFGDRKNHKWLFRADLDAFKGNSGSPVFNADTLEVEGILFKGHEDFVKSKNSVTGKKCMAEQQFRVEEKSRNLESVFRITKINY